MASFLEEFGAKELWQAHARILNHALSYTRSMCLKCAIELGIADVIHSHGKPITLSQLETELRIPPARSACFRRLMRLLVRLEYFSQISESESEKTLFGLTAMSALIMKEKMAQGGRSRHPFEVAHGKDIFEVTKQNPEFNSLLQAGMASDARLVVQVLIRECGDVFRGLRSLVDVGGGTGTMAMAIAEAYPQLKCTVFDLPHVVAPLWVLHDWSDAECVRILQRCKEAIPSKEEGGKVVIVEMVLNVDDSLPELSETQLLFDLHMMANTSGKQRSEAEWGKLFKSAGFSDYTLKPLLDLRSVIEVYH
ncbi:o-methyltransferase [Musa troglodytarum]|uniref:O-methyltransferase n=1 Tax=Musa troglodytarum TaxID=320322 RepID=A0A9E7FWN9_9LILI|nr:o-methyltransferase [Musa troglodytarum]